MKQLLAWETFPRSCAGLNFANSKVAHLRPRQVFIGKCKFVRQSKLHPSTVPTPIKAKVSPLRPSCDKQSSQIVTFRYIDIDLHNIQRRYSKYLQTYSVVSKDPCLKLIFNRNPYLYNLQYVQYVVTIQHRGVGGNRRILQVFCMWILWMYIDVRIGDLTWRAD